MNNSFIRSVFALIIGLVLVIWPDLAADYLVITVGALFIIPGLLGIIGYFAGKKKEGNARSYPVASIGSALLGLLLLIMPGFFADVLMFLLGLILILGGAQQIFTLISARKWTRVPMGFFVVPSFITLAGIVILSNPTGARNTAFMIIGFTGIVYAISELVNWFQFINRRPKVDKGRSDITDVEILDE